MLKKVILTICLALLLVGSVFLVVVSMGDVESKMNLETASQTTMETMKAAEPQTGTAETEEETEEETEAAETQSTEEAETETEEETEETEEETEETEEETEEETSSNPYAPSLKLSSSQVVINAGETLDLIAQVEEVSDDSDNYYDLYRRISVSGDYDFDTPGEYTLIYTVSDSNGNQSVPRYLKVIVK